MPSVLETPETVATVETVETTAAISWQTFEEERVMRSSFEVAPLPKRARFAAFFQKLRLSSAQEPHSLYRQPIELQSIDRLARDNPYLFTRLLCG